MIRVLFIQSFHSLFTSFNIYIMCVYIRFSQAMEGFNGKKKKNRLIYLFIFLLMTFFFMCVATVFAYGQTASGKTFVSVYKVTLFLFLLNIIIE